MKSLKFKNLKLLSLVISVIAVLLLTIMSVSAKDFTYSGAGSSSGGGGVSSNGGYSLVTTDGYQPIVAYRFSVLKNDGTVAPGEIEVDIYNNSWIKYNLDGDPNKRLKTYEELYGVTIQYNKQHWINGRTFNNDYTIEKRKFVRAASSGVGDGKMPHDPTKMEDWLTTKDSNGEYSNALAVFALCGFKTEDKIKNDYNLVIEPVIQAKVDHKHTAATNTELAVCGGMEYSHDDHNGYYDTGRGGDETKFERISFRVCHHFANFMYINGTHNLWPNAPFLYFRDSNGNIISGESGRDINKSDAATFYNVIHKAYSVNLLEAKDIVKQVTVNIYPNGSVYTYGGVKYDKTKCTFTVPAGSQITLPEAKRIYWHNPEWRIYKQGSNNMADYKSAKVGGTITVNENIDIVPYYSEKKVRYNVNGGKAEESATWRSGSDDLIMKNNAVFETKPVVKMNTNYRDSSGYWQWIENKDTTPFKLSSSSTPPLGSCQSRHIEKNVKSTP